MCFIQAVENSKKIIGFNKFRFGWNYQGFSWWLQDVIWWIITRMYWTGKGNHLSVNRASILETIFITGIKSVIGIITQ